MFTRFLCYKKSQHCSQSVLLLHCNKVGYIHVKHISHIAPFLAILESTVSKTVLIENMIGYQLAMMNTNTLLFLLVNCS